MALDEQAREGLLEKIPAEYKSALAEYLKAAKDSEEWLEHFPQSMQWVLRFSPEEILRKFSEIMGEPFFATRTEPADKLGREFLELAQRRHTAADALIVPSASQPAEFKYGTGWGKVKEADQTSVDALLEAYRSATDRLLESLVQTPSDRVIIQKKWGSDEVQRQLTPVDVINELTNHERLHEDMFRFVYNMIQAPFPPHYKRAVTTPIKNK